MSCSALRPLSGRPVGGHAHRFGQRADLQRDVDRSRLSDGEHDAHLLEHAEASQLAGHLVRAGRKVAEDVAAILTRDHESSHPGVGLGHFHFRARQSGAGFINHRPRQLGDGYSLRSGDRRERQRGCQDQPHIASNHTASSVRSRSASRGLKRDRSGPLATLRAGC
jgi:hypothetical protein